MIQNENINEHKLHFKASLPNGFWIKNDRSFRMEKMEFCRACFAAEVGRDWSFSVYKANTIHLHTEPFPVFSADRPTSILRRISLQKSLIYGWVAVAPEKAGIWQRIFAKRSEEGFVGLEMLRRKKIGSHKPGESFCRPNEDRRT